MVAKTQLLRIVASPTASENGFSVGQIQPPLKGFQTQAKAVGLAG